MLDPENEIFVVHVASLSSEASPSSSPLDVHPFQMEQRLILRTRLLTVYAVGRYFRLWELSVFRPLVEEMRLSFLDRHWMAWSLSGRLDATEFAPPLYRCQPRQMTRAHLLIGSDQGCWLDDKGAPPQVIG